MKNPPDRFLTVAAQKETARCFPAAHLTILDVDVIVVFVNDDAPDKHALYGALQQHARNIVILWRDAYGRARFIAPPEQHSFFRIVDYDQLYAQVNGSLDLPR